MRNFENRNVAPQNACITIKMLSSTKTDKYNDCKERDDLPFENGCVYAVVPIERLAVDAILEIWNITDDNLPRYISSYIMAANNTLRQNVEEPIKNLETADLSDVKRERFAKTFKVVDMYQKALKEKGLDFPEPFGSPDAANKENSQQNTSQQEELPLNAVISFIEKKPPVSDIQLFIESLANEAPYNVAPENIIPEVPNEEKPVEPPKFDLPPINVTAYMPEKEIEEPAEAIPAQTASGVPIESEDEFEISLNDILSKPELDYKPEAPVEITTQPDVTHSVAVTPEVQTEPNEKNQVQHKETKTISKTIEEPTATVPSIDFELSLTVDDILGTAPEKEICAPVIAQSKSETTPVSVPETSESVNNSAKPSDETESSEVKSDFKPGFTIEPIEDIDDDDDEDIYANFFK